MDSMWLYGVERMKRRRSRWIDEPVDWDSLDPSMDSLYATPVTYLVYNPATELVKIGFTGNLPMRIRSLSSQHKVEMELLSYRPGHGGSFARQRGDAHDVEQDLHDEFAQHRVEGEWFKPALEIYEWFGVR